MCNIAAGKWDVSGVIVHKCFVGFRVLLDDNSCYLSVAQWLAQQNPTVEVPVQLPGGQNIRPLIFVILWTLCYQPIMGLKSQTRISKKAETTWKWVSGWMGTGGEMI